MNSCGVFPVFDEKPLIFQHFYTFFLWKNLWRMWKTPVEKGVDNVEK